MNGRPVAKVVFSCKASFCVPAIKWEKKEEIMIKKLLAVAKSGLSVYVGEETLKHMEAHSDVQIAHVKEAISKLEYNAPFWIGAVDLGRSVGKDHCVEITDADDVRMEVRPNRDGATPIVYGRSAADTSLVVIGICHDDDGLETLFTAFYGQLAPKEPWDPHLKDEERAESERFWSTHALVAEG